MAYRINNLWRDPIDVDQCDWAYKTCKRPVTAVVALRAHDEGVGIAATAERRPFCEHHLGVCVSSYTRSRPGPIEVWPITEDDLCAMVEQRGCDDYVNADPLDLLPPSAARLHEEGETI